jgi:hypothetical protein
LWIWFRIRVFLPSTLAREYMYIHMYTSRLADFAKSYKFTKKLR